MNAKHRVEREKLQQERLHKKEQDRKTYPDRLISYRKKSVAEKKAEKKAK